MRTMSVTMEERLYRNLKRVAGPRGMSRFIAEAVRDKLDHRQDDLYQEYLEASRDRRRRRELSNWDALETDGWR